MHHSVRDGFAKLAIVLPCELDLESVYVLVEILGSGGAGDGNDILALRHQECKRELGRGATLLISLCLDFINQLEVPRKVLGVETWGEFTEIAFLEVIRAPQDASQEASAQRCVRNRCDAELPTSL